jgi:hypothetical protein
VFDVKHVEVVLRHLFESVNGHIVFT